MDVIKIFFSGLILLLLGCSEKPIITTEVNEMFVQILERDTTLSDSNNIYLVFYELQLIPNVETDKKESKELIDLNNLKILRDEAYSKNIKLISKMDWTREFYQFSLVSKENNALILRDHNYPCLDEVCFIRRTYFFKKENDQFVLERFLDTAES